MNGQTLHGGGDSRPDVVEQYFFKGGRFYSGMVVVEYVLADEGPGDGGLAIVPGSHKSNLRRPTSLTRFQDYHDAVTEVHAKKGDVIVFTETALHGVRAQLPSFATAWRWC
jgi:ectoine hydroxylase-related dioxygenase (phytanoyl-CoA dioxygenase family)